MKLITLNRIHDPRGTLSAVDERDCPFPIRRVYYLYDIPGGETQRGGHANIRTRRLIFALSGSFEIEGYPPVGGDIPRLFFLNRPWVGVDIPPLTWLTLRSFSSGAVALILASLPYDADDYIRDFARWHEYSVQAQLMEKP